MTTTQTVPSAELQRAMLNLRVRWRSSYQDCHSYECFFGGASCRFEVLTRRRIRDTYSNLSPEEFERDVNGSVGLVRCGLPLSLEAVAGFNRSRYDEYEAQIDLILAQPEKYGDYTPEPFRVYLGGVWSKEAGWSRLHTFDEVLALSGIPASEAVDGTQHP
ncbi:hypothetical protein [Pseudomonas oryzihabitans]|uniref:Uncharacterized protein n=1 Tax=Pseudomonas oryzihabitans TaxID=47885 RepID=A0A1G5PIE8_9PSED|nr:hypothetical protein [Pseudomonas psychrotolerans]NMY92741.1 hypothetical protein [Pseudomonas psychrotolerans]SCZ48860.1 hypothetical protein SAMN05216279_13714 [Pseudomonas psychrotolerans]